MKLSNSITTVIWALIILMILRGREMKLSDSIATVIWAFIILMILALCYFTVGCDRPLPVGPGPVPTEERPGWCDDSVPLGFCLSERVDGEFSWDRFHGFTAFALGESVSDIRGLYLEAMSHGWETARVCAETEYWDGGNYPRKPRDLDGVRRLLETVARIPGAQVLLIGNCTLKGPVPLPEQLNWTRSVAELASGYRNVAIETHNEFWNCRGRGWGSHCPGKSDVVDAIRAAREAGVREVTADDHICKGPNEPKTYEFRLANVGARPTDFHPCRSLEDGAPWDPNLKFLAQIARFNGPFVLSETVAWMDWSGECDGLRTCDQERIQSYVDRCAATPGCQFTYHSENLLAGRPPTWWPEAR